MQGITLDGSEGSAFVKATLILVATDLTDGDYLIPHAIVQAKASDARVMLIHAAPPSKCSPAGSRCASCPSGALADRKIQLELQGMAREVEHQGISCEIFFQHGFAAEVIREKVESTGATRLIMGTHGRGKLGQLAFGSVANSLLGSLEIPIFLVGPHSSCSAGQVTPRRILHPVSLSGDYQRSAEAAFDAARTHQAELTLLHVVDPDAEEEADRKPSLLWSEKELLKLASQGGRLMPPVQIRATYGDVVEKILDFAAQSNADWIVLGVDGGYSLPLQNRNAYKIVAAAQCPVLTVRHEPRRAGHEEQPAEAYFEAAIGESVIG